MAAKELPRSVSLGNQETRNSFQDFLASWFPHKNGFLDSFLDDALDDFLVNVRVQHADEREIAVTLREVKTVADDKKVGDLEADKIRLHVVRPARGFVEQHNGFDATRLERLKLGNDAAQGFAGVE